MSIIAHHVMCSCKWHTCTLGMQPGSRMLGSHAQHALCCCMYPSLPDLSATAVCQAAWMRTFWRNWLWQGQHPLCMDMG
jgi:hypothetical protein